MEHSSSWDIRAERPSFPALNATIDADVAVIGGGIAGVMTAYQLAKAGKRVALLEKGKIADGETGWTTAFVTCVTDASLTELTRTFGAAGAKLAWASGQLAIDEIERIIAAEHIDCDFVRRSAYIYAPDTEGLATLHREYELASSYGFPVAMKDAPLGFSTTGYIEVPNQATFHPVKFVTELAKRAEKLGVQIFEQTEATGCTGPEGIVETKNGKVRAETVILATHIPYNDPDDISSRITAYQSYVIEATIPKGVLKEAIYWDTNKPYHYFRVDGFADHDRLILGGEDHKTGQGEDSAVHTKNLETFLKELLPGVSYTIVRTWSGQILETIDGLPYIGDTFFHKHHLMATGFSGNGMTFGVLSGLINRDHILGKTTEMSKLYSPRRLKGLKGYMERGANFVSQWMKGKMNRDTVTLESVNPGEGAIVDIDGKKVAIYKSPSGHVVKLSPVCTHLGCTVQWNTEGKTWDCPCHGSRFKKEGGVLNGPATKPLEKI
ncbi:MAG: FAD-dependent oxidoreductase [Patescibacteria group bacterium]